MQRIYAIITNTICIIIAVNYAQVARHPLVDVLMSIAVICALQLFIIVLGKFVSKKVMRFLRPIARTTNLLLPFLFVPLGALLLSVMTDKKSSDGLEGIILICATAGIALLMIVFNRDLTEG